MCHCAEAGTQGGRCQSCKWAGKYIPRMLPPPCMRAAMNASLPRPRARPRSRQIEGPQRDWVRAQGRLSLMPLVATCKVQMCMPQRPAVACAHAPRRCPEALSGTAPKVHVCCRHVKQPDLVWPVLPLTLCASPRIPRHIRVACGAPVARHTHTAGRADRCAGTAEAKCCCYRGVCERPGLVEPAVQQRRCISPGAK